MKLFAYEAKSVALRSARGEVTAQLRLVEASRRELEAENFLALKGAVEKSIGNECYAPNDASVPITARLRKPSRVTTGAAVERLNLIHNTDVFDLALDTAESIGASNAIEKMIAHELAAAHKTAMDLLERCKEQGDPTREIKSINAAARLMTVVQQGALAIQRLKGGGNQVMTIRHVTVENGGQAIIGNVQGVNPNSRDQEH